MNVSDALVAEIQREFPRFRLIHKREDRLSKAIAVALRIVTFGAQDQYLSTYHTVIGSVLYVPESWTETSDIDRAIVLRHERVHLRQRERHGFIIFAFLYLVPVFPLGLAYFRARFEWEAYEETLRATAELKGWEAAADEALRERIIERFTGGDYGWMWPFRRQVERWYDDALSTLGQHDTAPEQGRTG